MAIRIDAVRLLSETDRRSIVKFSTLALARLYRERCISMHMIVLGDDGKYWVARSRITEQLVKEGYEYAE